MISRPMVRAVQTVHLSCIEINTVSKWSETSFHLTHVTKENHQLRRKWFLSLWYVRRKPCTFLVLRLTLSTNGPKQASIWPLSPRCSIWWRPKWFLSLWYVRRKPCNYLAPRLTLSPNGPHVTKEFHRLRPKQFPRPWYIRFKSCTNLAPRLTISPNGPKCDSNWTTSSRSTIECVQNDFRAYGMFCANRAPILHRD